MRKEIVQLATNISKQNNIEAAILLAFIEVETGGKGFDDKTGKIIIQFEPSWFKKKAPYAPSGLWSINKVDVQSKEWIAFNDAFKKNAGAAMESTSIGLGQIMGFHWEILGFKSVGEMWDFAKKGEKEQIAMLITFLNTYKKGAILSALKDKNFTKVAELYNGTGFREVAKKYKREPYDISMKKAYQKYSVN